MNGYNRMETMLEIYYDLIVVTIDGGQCSTSSSLRSSSSPLQKLRGRGLGVQVKISRI